MAKRRKDERKLNEQPVVPPIVEKLDQCRKEMEEKRGRGAFYESSIELLQELSRRIASGEVQPTDPVKRARIELIQKAVRANRLRPRPRRNDS